MYGDEYDGLEKKRGAPLLDYYLLLAGLLIMKINAGKIHPPQQPEYQVAFKAIRFFIGQYKVMPVHKPSFVLVMFLPAGWHWL